ncbi:MAG TPA: phage holin family protein [Gemmatimonadaceae bacterium]|nr:phage holin family protein [Gemmatimonadaceae bacterium]
MAHRDVRIDPDATIGDLVSRLGDDGKRLLGDEVQLAKLEIGENLRTASRGMVWLGVALALAFVGLTALTVGLSAVIGRVLTDALWLGTLLTGVLWLVLGGVLVKSGIGAVSGTSYSLPQTRRELALTRDAIAHADRR